MSESQGSTNQPKKNDDENQSSGQGGQTQSGLDVSGSFAIASNPDQFFQTSIEVKPEERGPSQPTAFTNPGALPPDPRNFVAPAPPVPEPNQQPQATDLLKPTSTADDDIPYNPDPMGDDRTLPFGPAPTQQSSEPYTLVGNAPAPQPQPSPQQPENPYYPRFQMPTNPYYPPVESEPQQPAPQAPLPQGNNVQPTAQPQPRVPTGFFDNQNPAGTMGGAAPQPGAVPNPAQGQPGRQQLSGGLTAEQAFFFGGEQGAPQQQPVTPPASDSSFQSFYQAPQPDAQHQTPGFQQAPGAQPGYQPGQAQPGGNPMFPQANQAPYAQPNLLPGSYQQYQADPNLGNPAAGPMPHQQSLPGTSLNLVTDKRADAADADKPRVKKKKKRPKPVVEEKSEDFSQAEIEEDGISRFQKLIVTPETKGALMFTIHQAREILFAPDKFFAAMPQRGNPAEPALFLMIVVGACGLLAGVINFNLLITVQFVIGNMIGTYALAFFVHKLFLYMGSAESYDANFRVIAYSQAALIVAGLKFNLLGSDVLGYVTVLIAYVISLRLQLIGMKHVHDELPTSKLILALLLPALLIFVVRFNLHLL